MNSQVCMMMKYTAPSISDPKLKIVRTSQHRPYTFIHVIDIIYGLVRYLNILSINLSQQVKRTKYIDAQRT